MFKKCFVIEKTLRFNWEGENTILITVSGKKSFSYEEAKNILNLLRKRFPTKITVNEDTLWIEHSNYENFHYADSVIYSILPAILHDGTIFVKWHDR